MWSKLFSCWPNRIHVPRFLEERLPANDGGIPASWPEASTFLARKASMRAFVPLPQNAVSLWYI